MISASLKLKFPPIVAVLEALFVKTLPSSPRPACKFPVASIVPLFIIVLLIPENLISFWISIVPVPLLVTDTLLSTRSKSLVIVISDDPVRVRLPPALYNSTLSIVKVPSLSKTNDESSVTSVSLSRILI